MGLWRSPYIKNGAKNVKMANKRNTIAKYGFRTFIIEEYVLNIL
ncbi:hypothetical protein KAOT1_02857 [Kordia algicida OT-1]|uniref:Uncharacterized protein n=1 Tax=Kordia algicida OT-1 TaxID=391587 RepID=A9DUN9_9FLAO|nr:hypothetical protein KAOT1_02857 [Kordia algicida OT-1]